MVCILSANFVYFRAHNGIAQRQNPVEFYRPAADGKMDGGEPADPEIDHYNG